MFQVILAVVVVLAICFMIYVDYKENKQQMENSNRLNFPPLPYSLAVQELYAQLNKALNYNKSSLKISTSNLTDQEFEEIYRGLISYEIGVNYLDNKQVFILDLTRCTDRKLSVRMIPRKSNVVKINETTRGSKKSKVNLPHEMLRDYMFVEKEYKDNVIKVDFINKVKVS